MEVVWVCFDVLFFISEFHFLFLLIFILFWLACIYLCCWCFPLGVYFNVCFFAYLFRLHSLFVFIYCLCYVTVLYFKGIFHTRTYTKLYTCTYQGRIQDFKLGGGALKKIAPNGRRRENFWGISCEKSRFDAKESYFFQF